LGKTQTQTQQRKQLQVSEKLEDILRKDPSVQTVRGQVRLLLPHDPERELNIGILTDRGDLVRVRREADSVGADLMMRVAQLIEARGRVSTNAEGDPVMTVLHFRVLRQNE
jgi:ribosomal protein L1